MVEAHVSTWIQYGFYHVNADGVGSRRSRTKGVNCDILNRDVLSICNVQGARGAASRDIV